MAAAKSATPRTRTRKPSSGENGDGTVTDISNGDRARRVFQGVQLDDRPEFQLVSAADPERVMDFIGVPALPGLPTLQLMTDGVSSDTLEGFFRQVLGDQFVDFEEFCNDPENGINVDVLVALATYLLEEYTGRPTKRSAKS
jgi:hypothetical protein